jgi:hypothetical protein
MDTKQYSLKSLTFKVQKPLIGGLAIMTPYPEICKRDNRRTEAALRSYSVIIIICDYFNFLPSLRADKRLGMLPWASKSPSKPFRPQILKDQLINTISFKAEKVNIDRVNRYSFFDAGQGLFSCHSF